jgi:ADP-heptose:LPS heptosyltransferase
MKKVIIMLDGGAGRIITAIPALKKYLRLNPSHDLKIFLSGWSELYWSIPELQQISFDLEHKGCFENYFLKADEVLFPEPYQLPNYYKQKISLAEAFDEIINKTEKHEDLGVPQLSLSNLELSRSDDIKKTALDHGKKEKTILIQPFGRTAEKDQHGNIIDISCRSIESEMYLHLCKELSKNYNLLLMAEPDFYLKEDVYTIKPKTELRGLLYMVKACDYFIGCDSVGQHISRAFNKPGSVFVGSSFSINTSYPDHFQIIEKNTPKLYAPLRLVNFETNFINRFNEKCVKFSDDEKSIVVQNILTHIKITSFNTN